VDNIKLDRVEIVWGDVDWIGLAQDMDKWGACNELSCSIKGWEFIEWSIAQLNTVSISLI
jgi:hypothetical protein